MTLMSLIVLAASACLLHAQTVGVITHDSSRTQPGYTLFSPTFTTTTYLINTSGELLHTWPSAYVSGFATLLLNDGSILRAGRRPLTKPGEISIVGGGVVEIIEWNGNVRWTFERSLPTGVTHHDVEAMPNGNVMLTEWYVISKDSARKLGRVDASTKDTVFWLERVIEVLPVGPDSGEVVWQWDAIDHLIQNVAPEKVNYGVLAEHPERLDINAGTSYPDWLHLNSVRYNAARDEVMISVHGTNEILVLQRSTGEIVYRWGNPKNYGRGTVADQKLFGQHDARWIESGTPGAGNITIFNNGVRRPAGSFSTFDEIVPPLDGNGKYVLPSAKAFGPDTLAWQYKPPIGSTFYAQIVSGWTRQPNGTALACMGDKGIFVEVSNNGDVVWKYVSPVGRDRVFTQGQTPIGTSVFKINRYPTNHPAFAGKSITPQGTLESIALDVSNSVFPQSFSISFVPGTTTARVSCTTPTTITLQAYDVLGRLLGTVSLGSVGAGTYSVEVPKGTLFVKESKE